MNEQYCCYCGRQIAPPYIRTDEHLVPRSKRGNNSLYNVVSCCNWCNTWRSSTDLMLWKNEIVTLINEHRTKPPYSRYDLLIMVENIDYWIDYINEKWSLLVKKDRKGVNMPTLQKEVEVTQLWFDFCNNLPNIWIKKGYSLEEVAEKVGMRSHCLSRIAAGKDLFNVNTLIILADALDMRVEFVPNELK